MLLSLSEIITLNSRLILEKIQMTDNPDKKEMPKKFKALEIQHGGTHYKNLKIEPADYCHQNNIGFLAGNAIKYLTRYKDKGGAEDLKKSMHFTQMLLNMDYGIETRINFSDEDLTMEVI